MWGMSRRRPLAVLCLMGLLILALFGESHAQRFDSYSVRQNEPPETEFIFARSQYSGFRGGWEHDYPDVKRDSAKQQAKGAAIKKR